MHSWQSLREPPAAATGATGNGTCGVSHACVMDLRLSHVRAGRGLLSEGFVPSSDHVNHIHGMAVIVNRIFDHHMSLRNARSHSSTLMRWPMMAAGMRAPSRCSSN